MKENPIESVNPVINRPDYFGKIIVYLKENPIESVNPMINRPDYFGKIIVYLKKYLKFILVSLIVGAVAGYCIAHFLITPTYQSYLDLYVNVNSSTSNKNTDTVNTGDIDASQKLVNSYIVTLKANIVTNQIVKKLNGRISKNELLNSVSFRSIFVMRIWALLKVFWTIYSVRVLLR